MRLTAQQMIASKLWLIEPAALEMILDIADRKGDPDALAEKLGRPLENSQTVELRDGVAIVPVVGPIFRYANLFTALSGATSTQVLATDIRTALDNPAVKAIVLDINSPGGEATGIHELSQMIFDARGTKPITAYVGGMGASAAYWIASAADQIVIDRTSALGSIGVVSEVRDTSERDAKNGTKTYTVVSTVSPKKRPDFSTSEGRSELQRRVDALGEIFVETIARNRGTSIDKVLADFGQGGVLTGKDAIAVGMADEFGSLESVISVLAGSVSKNVRRFSMTNKADAKGPVTVSSTAELQAALQAGHKADEITIAAVDKAAIRAEGMKEGEAKAAADVEVKTKAAAEAATKAERDRIIGIQAVAMPGFEKETTEAIASGVSVADASVAMLRAVKDRGITLGAIRSDSTLTTRANPGEPTAAAGWDKAAKKAATRGKR